MCGRLDMNDVSRLLQDFSWIDEVLNRSQAPSRYNAPPGTFRPILRMVDDRLTLNDAFWSYQAAWAVGKVPACSNTRLEKITNRYWGPLLKRGRAIVPACGWYEWVGEKPNKQPYHIHRKDRELLYIAALGNFAEAKPEDNKAATGFTLVTADAIGGMVDVHDRRPVVFSAADAALWMDPATPAEMAEQLARTSSLGPEWFDWFKVSKAVGPASNEGQELAQPIGE
jgi:putative SOS response-associated peptidase YedK